MYANCATSFTDTAAAVDDDLQIVEAGLLEEVVDITSDAYCNIMKFSLSDYGLYTIKTIVDLRLCSIDLRLTKIPEPRGRSRICCVYDLREDCFSVPGM